MFVVQMCRLTISSAHFVYLCTICWRINAQQQEKCSNEIKNKKKQREERNETEIKR